MRQHRADDKESGKTTDQHLDLDDAGPSEDEQETDADDAYMSIELVVRLQAERSAMQGRIDTLERLLKERASEGLEEDIDDGTCEDVGETKDTSDEEGSSVETLKRRVRNLERRLMESETARKKAEDRIRAQSNRRMNRRIDRRRLLTFREVEKNSKSAKELYSSMRMNLRKTNSPLLREAALQAKRRSNASMTSISSFSSDEVPPQAPPLTPPSRARIKGDWNKPVPRTV